MTTSPTSPWLTVIVISKDDLPGLTAALRSIESQKLLPDEVVVVTKGSSSNIDVADFHLPGLRHKVQEDKGISAAFNLALSMARGEWVNFLNGGDTYSHPDALATLRPRLREDLDIVAARARDTRAGNLFPRYAYVQARQVDQIAHQASLFRRALFERHGGYSPDFKIRMDFEWMMRVAKDVRVEWIDEVLVDFEGGGASSIDPVRSCREELDALRRHRAPWPRRARLLGLYLPFRVVRGWLRNLRGAQP
jgi:glycosyltransferase involved in cell wall biosynthesis